MSRGLASFQIAIAKPVRIGDTVKYQDYWGYVESIYYSFLVLRVWDGRRLVVPVQYFITYPFENWSMVDARITRTFTLRLDHCARPGELRDVFEKIVAEDDDAVDGGMTLTLVTEHNEDYQEISFVATGSNPADTWLMEMRLREAMGDWIRDHHPEWWQSDRLLMARSGAGDTC
ncbi:mechanosensitive ion channel domain-containing protein [Wenzhouxiangella sp. XN24]|uniref:mechanosensitive ion channel family protein n=1 Tax=Wenzhouxiangella sp. XN24 TaxID=2713569 RepID=UPI0013EC80C2|nr:mechanosensitive ion channel domain-containing protein [Wenzhouxiangella sp. XN24]NGX17120.1 mechanosensitive ion channel [Wenzhouxiangella sp. XN24]